MVKTDSSQFETFHKCLTANEGEYIPFYFKLQVNSKDPAVNKGESWKDKRLSFEEALEYMNKGGNIGIAATSEDRLVIVDVDDMEAVGPIKPTLTAISSKRYGRHGFYFTDDKVPDCIDGIEEEITETCKRNLPCDDAGEVRSNWQYVVAPGSFVTPTPEKMAKIPPDEIENAGKYTVLEARPPETIIYDELPQVYKAVHEERKASAIKAIEKRTQRATQQVKNKHINEQNKSALWDLDITDVTGLRGSNKRIPSIFHGSDTGANTSVENGLLHCWRHLVSHNALTALAVMAGIADCNDGYRHHTAGNSNIDLDDGGTIFKIWQHAKEQGHIPQNDPIPTKAFCYYVVSKGYCEQDDIEDGWKIPHDAYNQAIAEAAFNMGRAPLKTSRDSTSEEQEETYSIEQIREMGAKINDLRLTINVQEDHFLNLYAKWMEGITDAYTDYTYCAGLWLLSACTKNRIKLELQQTTVRPNLWFIILGLSSVSRKTTVLNKTKRVYESCTQEKLYNDDYSLEGYLELLQEEPNRNFIRDECTGLLQKMRKKYNDGIFDLECQIYDCEPVRKTLAADRGKKKREVVIDDPFVTKLYGTTPDNFSSNMTLEDMFTGYGPRFLFCHPKYNKASKPLTLATEEDRAAFGKVVTSYVSLYDNIKAQDEILFDAEQDAMDYFEQVNNQMERNIIEENDNLLSMAWARGSIHAFKIAMLLEIGKSTPSYTITLESMAEACRVVIEYFLPMFTEVMNRLQEDIRNNQIEKVRHVLLKNNATLNRSDLLKYSRLKKKDFDEVILTMLESGEVTSAREEKTNKTWYVLVDDKKTSRVSPISHISPFHRDNKKLCEKREIDSKSNNLQTCACKIDSSCETVKRVKNAKSVKLSDEHIPKIMRFCKDWETIFQKSINSNNAVSVAMEYCKKMKYDNMDGVMIAVKHFAGIPTSSEVLV